VERLYLIIDAVDESDDKDRRDILQLLFDLCSRRKHCVLKVSTDICKESFRGQSVVKEELVLSTMGRGQLSIYTCSRHSSAAQPACRRRLFWAVL